MKKNSQQQNKTKQRTLDQTGKREEENTETEEVANQTESPQREELPPRRDTIKHENKKQEPTDEESDSDQDRLLRAECHDFQK